MYNKYSEKLDNKLSIYERTIVVAANNNILHKQIIDILNDNERCLSEVGVVSQIDRYHAIYSL